MSAPLILDDQTNEPIAGALVEVFNNRLAESAISDSIGRFLKVGIKLLLSPKKK